MTLNTIKLQLVWLLFLKFLDDFEIAQERLLGENYTPIIADPYRWRDWTASNGLIHLMRENDLPRFVNGDFIPYLRRLSGADNRDIRTIIGTIFHDTENRIRSDTIFRKVVDQLNTINFNSSDDLHTISIMYDTMLKEMRDSTGEAGEYYNL